VSLAAGIDRAVGVPLRVAGRTLRILNPVRTGSATIDGLWLLKRHRRLVMAMARRELISRYAGQLMGSFWVIGHPLFMMLIFVFLFAVVFQTKIGGTLEMPRDYTVYILSGLIPWLSMLPVITGGCLSILGNVALVKQFNFELEILPVRDVLVAMIFWIVGIAIIGIYTVYGYHALAWTWVLLPAVVTIHMLTMIGVAWLLSAITVFFRDLKDIMTVVSALGVYLLPVVYLPEWIPDLFRPLIYVNPFSYLIWVYQDALYYGRVEHPVAWPVSVAVALVAFSSGHRVFKRLRPLFGNAL